MVNGLVCSTAGRGFRYQSVHTDEQVKDGGLYVFKEYIL